MGRLLLLVAATVMVSCAGSTPTTPRLLSTSAAPPLTQTMTLAAGQPLRATVQDAHPLSDAPPSDSALAATISPLTPTPTRLSAGIRADQAQLRWPPDTGPAPPSDWRPPPYEVPLSLHPDDHYWLIRPLPSGTRNYDLEYYPYGSDVLLAQYAPYRIHHGLDFPNPSGTPILAAASGEVIWAGSLPNPRSGINYYGNTVIIRHDWQWRGQDVFTLYAHTLELFVEVGEHVAQGELIAGVGASGEVSGPHLHLEVRIGNNNYYDTRNPLLWLAPYEGWGTLAGRFVDNRGVMIPGADITLYPVDADTTTRRTRTYQEGVDPDEVWRENFVVGDLPAGRYTLTLSFEGTAYRRTLDVLPGRTNFVVVAANFTFVPTPTPTPTYTPTPTVPLTVTLPITSTPTLTLQP